MAQNLSPGVNASVTVLNSLARSGNLTAVGTVLANVSFGPCNEIVYVSQEDDLRTVFGKSTASNYKFYLPVKTALNYTNSLAVVRCVNSTAANAKIAGDDVTVKNDSEFDAFDTDANQYIIAKYPGSRGNDFTFYIIDQMGYDSGDIPPSIISVLPYRPSETNWAKLNGVYNDEVHVVVVDADGTLAESPYFGLSKHANAKNETGSSLYYKDWLNAFSSCVRVTNHFDTTYVTPGETYLSTVAVATGGTGLVNLNVEVTNNALDYTGTGAVVVPTVENGVLTGLEIVSRGIGYSLPPTIVFKADAGTLPTATLTVVVNGDDVDPYTPSAEFAAIYGGYELAGGSDGNAPTAADLIAGWSLFNDPETVDIHNYFLGGSIDHTVVVQYVIDNIGEGRKDSLICLAPPAGTSKGKTADEAVKAVKNWALQVNRNSSFVSMVNTGVMVYDTDKNVMRNISGDCVLAGLEAQVIDQFEYYESPAIEENAYLKGVSHLEWVANKPSRDILYPLGINCFSNQAGAPRLFGDRTLTRREGPLSYIGSRVLVNTLIQRASKTLMSFLFKKNNDTTRLTVERTLSPLLSTLKSRQVITTASTVYCNEVNNTPAVINEKKLVATFLIQIYGSIQFIELKVGVSDGGVEISTVLREVEGLI